MSKPRCSLSRRYRVLLFIGIIVFCPGATATGPSVYTNSDDVCDEGERSCSTLNKNIADPPLVGGEDVMNDDQDLGIFDVFSKWIDDRSSEGQQFLEHLLETSDDETASKRDFKSLFGNLNTAFTSEQQADDDRINIKLWNTIFKAMNQGKASSESDNNIEAKPWYEQLSGAVDSIAKAANRITKENLESSRQESFSNIKEESSNENAAFDFMKFFQSIISISNKKQEDEESSVLVAEFIEKATEFAQHLQSGKSSRGFLDLHKLMMEALGNVSESMTRNFGHIDWRRLQPFGILYFLEHMETLYTPSCKRRMHSFSPSVSAEEVKEIHKALFLANLAYGDTVHDIKDGLREEFSDWELVYAQMKNAPGEPAHYIALRKDPLPSSTLPLGFIGRDYLDVLIVIRGTKDFSDVLSDGLLDEVDFRGGKTHAGLAQSGQFIVDHHRDLLQGLLNMSKRQKIKLTLVGHSLGAGAATIAGILFNEDEASIDAKVIGFGCPALLSKELSESSKNYVTTIISDSDMIPRLSGPTLANAVFDVMSYDWIERGLGDLQNVITFVRENLPFDIPSEKIEKVYDFIKAFLEEKIKPEMEIIASKERTPVVLMPPGQCVHFYRDGSGGEIIF